MSTEPADNDRKDYEVPCRLLPMTEFDVSESVAPEQLAGVPVGGFVRDEVLRPPVEWDCALPADQAWPRYYEKLKEELGVSDAVLEQVSLGPELEPAQLRLGLTEIEMALRELIGWVEALAPYVALGLWLVQAVVSRRQRYQLLIGIVAGMLEERGLADAEIGRVKEIATKELIRIGLPEDKADWAAKRVMEIVLEQLPPRKEADDQQAIAELVKRVKELAGGFPGWEFKEKPYGCRVKVPLPDSRHHSVHVISKAKDNRGRAMVELQAVCGKAQPDFVVKIEKILRRSAKLHFGNFSVRKINGVDYFVIQHRRRVEELSQSALNRIVPYLAEEADQVEAELKKVQSQSEDG